jgi:hypothetical protein
MPGRLHDTHVPDPPQRKHARLALESLESRDTPSTWYDDIGSFFTSIYKNVTHEVGSWFDSSRGKAVVPATANAPTRPATVFMPIAGSSIAPQNDGWSCGPNAAARFLDFYGYKVTYEVARYQATKTENAPFLSPGEWGQGTSPDALLALVRKYKPDARLEEEVTFDRLLDVVGSGKPAIVLVKPNPKSDIMHYFVVQGYDHSKQQIYYTDTDGKAYVTSYAVFQQMWNWSAGWFLNCVYDAVGMDPRTIVY